MNIMCVILTELSRGWKWMMSTFSLSHTYPQSRQVKCFQRLLSKETHILISQMVFCKIFWICCLVPKDQVKWICNQAMIWKLTDGIVQWESFIVTCWAIVRNDFLRKSCIGGSDGWTKQRKDWHWLSSQMKVFCHNVLSNCPKFQMEHQIRVG